MKILLLLTAVMGMVGCGAPEKEVSLVRSLTGDSYTGTKHYFGWGAAGRSDPSMMHNEVKYDVLHTHDIFVSGAGGDYDGIKEFGTHVGRSLIQRHWQEIGDQMTDEDMYVQYSSGHGYHSGLAVGVSYNDIRDNALDYPAKETVIFTMACHSGGIVDSFNNARSRWADYPSQGRSLLVMASSRTNQLSSTGPGRDSDEPGGPYGSAGSAFGHALWKALIGYGDGHADGVKDGYLSLEEIIEFTTYKTRQVGGHTPVHTGTFNRHVIMNRVPTRTFVESLRGGTEGMTEEEVAALFRSTQL